MILRHMRVVLAALAPLAFASAAQAETWYRADTHHFVIYSDGGEKNLEQFAHTAEKFDALLRIVFNRQPEQEPNRLTIYLLDRAASVDRLTGPKRTYAAGFYRPGAEGSFAVANRERAASVFDLDGQTVLFHEYAHHFMYRNFAVPVPAWFSEGFAEYASTADFRSDGTWEFGKVATHRAYSLQQGPNIPIRTLLTEQASGSNEKVSAFYGWSWALTHMFYRSGDNGREISRYLAALADGADPLTAAEAEFGDLDQLQEKLKRYVRGRMMFFRSSEPLKYLSDVKVTRLSDFDSALAELTLQRKAYFKPERTREKLMELTQGAGANAEAWYQLAALEWTAAHSEEATSRYDFSTAEATVDRALALEPGHVLANVLKGDILLEPFDHADDPDVSLWGKSRKYYAAANRADPLHPLPLYRFANSYLREGKPNPQVGGALQEAFLGAPEVNELRNALANHHANEGEFDRAIELLKVIAGNPHYGSDAREHIAQLEARRDGGGRDPETPPPVAFAEPQEGE
jgi:tetratricopeptide (TPR) repeat protein